MILIIILVTLIAMSSVVAVVDIMITSFVISITSILIKSFYRGLSGIIIMLLWFDQSIGQYQSILGGELVRGVLGIEFNPGTMCEGHVWFEYWVTLQMRRAPQDTFQGQGLLSDPRVGGVCLQCHQLEVLTGYSCIFRVRIHFVPPWEDIENNRHGNHPITTNGQKSEKLALFCQKNS